MNDFQSAREILARRDFFTRAGIGLAPLALGTMLSKESQAAAKKKRLQKPHHAPKAKSVIFLNMAGAPPQLDMFDYKPELERLHGKTIDPKFTNGERFAFIKGDAVLQGPLFKFKRYGQAGMWMSDVVQPWMPEIADDICMIHSATTTQFNHSPAALLLFTGFQRSGRPSMGSWINYGLGSEADDLPGFVMLASGRGARCGTDCFGAGFLPSHYQGVEFLSSGTPVMYLDNPSGLGKNIRRMQLDAISAANQAAYEQTGDDEILTRSKQYEVGYRMQDSVPKLADLTQEPKRILDMYGVQPGKRHFGNNCLLARRLVQRGVRFVQLNHGEWDLHGGSRVNIPRDCPRLCKETMPGVVALIKDLKEQKMLDETLVIWGSEFGRTPMLQLDKKANIKEAGRDHHRAFTFWMAGGGVKAGFQYGATDEIGYNVVENPIDPHDIQATILHLLGVNHERLTYRFQGRDYRLTDVHGRVMRDWLA